MAKSLKPFKKYDFCTFFCTLKPFCSGSVRAIRSFFSSPQNHLCKPFISVKEPWSIEWETFIILKDRTHLILRWEFMQHIQEHKSPARNGSNFTCQVPSWKHRQKVFLHSFLYSFHTFEGNLPIRLFAILSQEEINVWSQAIFQFETENFNKEFHSRSENTFQFQVLWEVLLYFLQVKL